MSANVDIKIGFWIDQDKSWFSKLLLTIPNREANFSIASISFLLASLILPFAWKTLVLILYISRYTRPSARTHELEQQRILFRNARTSANAVTGLATAFWHWRRRTKGAPWREVSQFFALIILASVCIIVLGVCGIFVPSLFASDTTDNVIVLAKAGSCGFLKVNDATAEIAEVSSVASRELDETTFARRYATQFYGNESVAERMQSTFPVLSLPFRTDTSAPCPFDTQMCFPGPGESIGFDTGLLDSHKHLGINAREKDRVQYRWKATCAPLRLDSTMVSATKGNEGNTTSQYAEFYLGESENSNVTFSWRFRSPENKIGYQVQTLLSNRGFRDAGNISWVPISPLRRPDADITLVFITQNQVAYSTMVHDRVFQANGTVKEVLQNGNGKLYLPDYNARFIACADHHEFCNPNNGLCSGLDGLLGPVMGPFSTMSTSKQLATVRRVQHDAEADVMEKSVKELGNNGLIANSVIGNTMLVSPGLPDNQWQLETRRWFETGLAKLQANTKNFANLRYSDRDSIAYKFIPAGSLTNATDLDSEMNKLCSQQRIRSNGQVQNFNVANIIILLVVSLITAFISEYLAPWVMERFCHVAYKEWEADGLLGIWKKCIDPRQQMTWARAKQEIYVVLEDSPEEVRLVRRSSK